MKKEIRIGNVIVTNSQYIIEYAVERFLEDKDKNWDFYGIDNENNSYKIEKIQNEIYNKDGINLIKLILKLDISKVAKIRIKMFDGENEYECLNKNNRGEDIVAKGNKFYIFTKNTILKLKEDKIKVSNRKMFDKLKYETKKQFFSLKYYKKILWYRLVKGKNKYYFFNDRMNVADDNAIAAFEYINKNEKEFAKKCYFVLNKYCPDVDMVKNIGKILYYGSFKHKLMYMRCKIVVSSHSAYIDKCWNPFNKEETSMYKDILTKQYMCIHHGIAMAGVHEYTNRLYGCADRYTSSTKSEFINFSENEYMFDKGQVVKTGMARYDKLRDSSEKIILISPTWRTEIIKKNNLMDSVFFKKYKALLNNKKLLDKLKETGYKIIFLPHPNFIRYKGIFEELKNENIEVVSALDIKYSHLFSKSCMLITDYSSIHFDMAYLKKPVIYYQYDQEDFYTNHYTKGNFDFETDAFGEVVKTEEDLISEIIKQLDNNCKMAQKYIDRLENTFFYTDKNNCKRVYEELIKLDNENDKTTYRISNVF